MAIQTLVSGNGDSRRTLLAIFLRGGADGLSLVAPVEDDDYQRARPRLGIAKKDAVMLDGHFGLHPLLKELEPAWKEGDLAIVHAAGSEDQSRSHFEAQDLMEHGGLAAGGWLGRFLRNKSKTGAGALGGIAIGPTLPESLSGAPSATALESLDEFSLSVGSKNVRKGLEELYVAEGGALAGAARDTFGALARIEAMKSAKYEAANGAVYGDDGFARGLLQIARLIKADLGLEAASLDLGGWDSHFTQGTLIEPLLSRLAKGLAAFRRDLGARMRDVTVVVMTEFGRRVLENSAFGTDHGRGGVMWVLGGGVKGGQMHGDWRGLKEDALEGPGDLPVWNNYRDVLAPVLLRHGLESAALGKVFPDYTLKPLALY